MNTPIYNRLHEAIANDDVELLASALSAGITSDDAEVLHVAARSGHTSVVKALLDAGWIDHIDAYDDSSLTPLMWAAIRGHVNVVRLLLERGAQINRRDELHAGSTVLCEVIETAPLELIRILIAAGADPKIPGWMGISAVEKAKERARNEQTEEASAILALLHE